MTAKIIHDNDVPNLQGRTQNSLYIKKEDFPIHGAIDDPWGRDPIMTQSGYEGQSLPVTMGNKSLEPLSFPAPSAGSGHIGLDPGLVQEDEMAMVEAS
jgi:hypothetical protein